jgi:hypothetical protein
LRSATNCAPTLTQAVSRRNYVDQFEMFNTIHTLDFQKVEDVYLNYPFSMKSRGSKLYTTKEILEELLD